MLIFYLGEITLHGILKFELQPAERQREYAITERINAEDVERACENERVCLGSNFDNVKF